MSLFHADKMKCPCEGCIVWTFCRQKKFSEFRYCDEISHYLGFEGKPDQLYPLDIKMHMRNYPKFYKCLKPTQWKYSHWAKGHEHYKKTYMIDSIT